MNGSATGRLVKPAGGLAIAAALVGALALTPVGSLAQSLLTVFQPQQVAPVAVTTADIQDLRNLPNLDAYGTVSGLAHPTLGMAPSAAAAGAALGVPVETPRTLPSGVPSSATYLTMAQSTASFTFSADRARAAAARDGKALPAMPAHVDGSTLQATIGPAVVAIYGGNVGAAGNGAARTSGDNGPLDNLPTLAIVQARVPVVTSTGASVNEIENYLLEQPGISPSLAAAIRRIGDPKTTLPIPVPVNLTSAQSTPVQGVTGLIIGDNTGIGSVVIWQKGGIIRAVAGALPQDQVLAIANGMH